MHFLILCILSSTGIFIAFKSIDRFNIPPFPVIIINYMVAALLGFLINPGREGISVITKREWFPAAVAIGVMFIVMFFLVAFSTRRAGISVTTVASKMSVVFPIVFSLIIDHSDHLTFLKTAAILCTLSGVAMTVYKPRSIRMHPSVVYLPLLLFVGMGMVDSMVKYAQYNFVSDKDTALFSAILFLNAFLAGILVLLLRPKHFRNFKAPAVWGWGVILGVVNFGSIFFLVRAMNYTSHSGQVIDSSIVFGMNNTGIVALSVLVGLWIFRERLMAWNWLGIALSAVALILFALR
jgi:drug/metabolite transporter (DMT)-like permease